MADKEKSRAERMYGKGNKIVPADGPGKEDKGAVKEINATAGKPEKDVPAPKREPARPTAAGGHTESGATNMALPGEDIGGAMPMGDVHDREMKGMHQRHERERRDMHTRHEQEHKEMRERHEKERGVPGSPGKGKEEHIDGKDGVEPNA